jgi:hypothetical protein
MFFIATLSNADGGDWASQDRRPVQATPDGRFLVFQSVADLTPDQEGQAGTGQVFEYDAQTGRLVRVSRGQNGYSENGNSSVYPATIPLQVYEIDSPDTRFTHLAVSADGSRVFFSSADALTPQALGGFTNIYEYRDGQVGLISDGHDTAVLREGSATELIGTNESGRDVFFTTADQILPQDHDTGVDIYDARMNGGFAPPSILAPCSGESCQGVGSAPPLLLEPGVSSGMGGVVAGPSAKPRAKVTTKKPKKHGKPKKRKRSPRRHTRGKGARAVGRGRR